MNSIKVSDYIAEFLHAQGVTHVYEVIGGMIANIVDSIHTQKKICLVSVHHEQAASFAADAAGRASGVPGVAMATSGPGATNLLTGIGSAFFDSSPTVFITGQVARPEQKGERHVRQLGFQETDIVTMAAPITKAAWRVRTAEEVPDRLIEAFLLAQTGRPGPVLVDIPMDVQWEKIIVAPPSRIKLPAAAQADAGDIQKVLDELNAARRPLILAGGGIRAARALDLFRRFVTTTKVPVVYSLHAVDALPFENKRRVGMIGSYGNRWANLALGRADYILVLGSRLDVRQTGALVEAFKGDRTIVHVDCDPSEINNRVKGCRAIEADLHQFLTGALAASRDKESPDFADWLAELAQLKAQWPDTSELRTITGINPNVFMHQLSKHARAAAAFVADVGQHQMWAAQSLELGSQQVFMTSGGMGAMGFALPAAVGTALVFPGRPVVMIAGDGGFQLNLQELQTVKRNRLPLKMIVINNHCHGMVRQFQESYFAKRYQSTYWGYSAPDFSGIAKAYGIDSETVAEPENVEHALDKLWKDSAAPFLLQVMVDPFANAYPKVAFGQPITEMEPFAKPVGMEGT
ncbi:MAG TPA: thiamine pyrophosphate-binding protein [Verrucomicrobiae bacterium]|nr:thiamine pyrophosphate-binding protein [Verrucomicrobiae bacterium]